MGSARAAEMRSDRLFLCKRPICDLSTHRYWHYPCGQDLCNSSFSKRRMNLHLGVFNSAGPQRAFAKVLSVLWRNIGDKQSCEMLRSVVIWTKQFTIIYSFDKNLYRCQCSFFRAALEKKKKKANNLYNYFIECIHTVKFQLLNDSQSI